MKYALNEPSISKLEKKYVVEALDSTWLSSNGLNTKIFERKFSKLTDNKFEIVLELILG